ncbi:MAG TPA: glycine cleavage system protein H, partial [Aquifex aeolicus]|nr:glycine cleavage system protein H [Aquifex aeolicus]
ALVNDDPYGQGWIAKLKPTNPDDVNQLLRGEEAVEALRKVAEEKGVKCE